MGGQGCGTAVVALWASERGLFFRTTTLWKTTDPSQKITFQVQKEPSYSTQNREIALHTEGFCANKTHVPPCFQGGGGHQALSSSHWGAPLCTKILRNRFCDHSGVKKSAQFYTVTVRTFRLFGRKIWLICVAIYAYFFPRPGFSRLGKNPRLNRRAILELKCTKNCSHFWVSTTPLKSHQPPCFPLKTKKLSPLLFRMAKMKGSVFGRNSDAARGPRPPRESTAQKSER